MLQETLNEIGLEVKEAVVEVGKQMETEQNQKVSELKSQQKKGEEESKNIGYPDLDEKDLFIVQANPKN